MKIYSWILVVSIYTGIECCENQTILCTHSDSRPEVCYNAVCSCYGAGSSPPSYVRRIICSGVLTEIPLNQFQKELIFVRMENNNITTIKRGTFSGLQSLELVYLGFNQIDTIETAAFKDIPFIRELDLQQNNLAAINASIFNNMRSLSNLFLKNNKIKSIETGSFAGMTHLFKLDLRNNKLTVIKSGTFYYLENLHFIILTGNKIRVIEKNSFINLPQLVKLDLSAHEISVITSHAFNNITGYKLNLSANEISVIERYAFRNILVYTIDLKNNKLTVIKSETFVSLKNLRSLILSENSIRVIEEYSFVHLPELYRIDLSGNEISVIASHAFFQVSVSVLNMSANEISVIASDAFFFVTVYELILGVDQGLVFEENFYGSFIREITILPQLINCNCSLMWIALWLQEDDNYGRFQQTLSCRNDIKTVVNNLTIGSFSHCTDMSECVESYAVSITCSFKFLMGGFVEWIHTRNSRHIRTLKTRSNVLSIPFCSIEDTGEYTCVSYTRYPSNRYINITTTLQVKGKPVIFNRVTHEAGNDLVLAVTLYSIIGVEIRWILDEKILQNSRDYGITTSTVQITLVQYNQEISVDALMTNLTIYNYNSLVSKAYTCSISNDLGSAEEVLLSRPIDIILQRNTLCDSSSRLEINCTLNAIGADPKYFIHISGGKTIRTLTGTQVNNTYTLTIPFCNYQDIGEYTCVWSTGIPGRERINKTTSLTVNGPPIMLHHSEVTLDAYTILSAMFYSQPYPSEPKWYLDDEEIVPGSAIQHTTSFSTVEIQLHRVTTYVNGFISNLTLKTERKMFGDYKCVVENSHGSAYEIIKLKREPTSINGRDSSASFAILPVILGAVGGVVLLALIVMVVVYLKRRLNQPKETRTCDESTRGRDNESYYDSIRMSPISTTTNAYLEAY